MYIFNIINNNTLIAKKNKIHIIYKFFLCFQLIMLLCLPSFKQVLGFHFIPEPL